MEEDEEEEGQGRKEATRERTPANHTAAATESYTLCISNLTVSTTRIKKTGATTMSSTGGGGGGGGGTGSSAPLTSGPRALEVETADVVKLVLQFCKENRLLHTMRTLQEEAQVGGWGGGDEFWGGWVCGGRWLASN